MSDVARNARVQLFMADFASQDAIGKINVVGMGAVALGFDAQNGVTSRFSVTCSVWLPSAFLPCEISIELALVDHEGTLVELPGPVSPQPMRIASVAEMKHANIPVSNAMMNHIGQAHHVTVDFNNGLPLAPNGQYQWRVELEGDEETRHLYPFIVYGPLGRPVVG